MRRYRVGFVLEQALGHVTHAHNLQRNVPLDSDVDPYWLPIPYESSGLASHLPLFKSNWTIRSGWRARRALADLTRRTQLDALVFHTQVPAILARDWIDRFPTVISLDATPVQVDQLGQFYRHRPGPPWLERLKWRLNRSAFRSARHLVTWTDWTKSSLVSDYSVPPERVTVIPPGVTPSEWARPSPRQSEDTAQRPIRILFVGANLDRKGGHLLLRAFRHLRPLGMELHLVTKDSVPQEPGVFVHNHLLPNSDALKRLYHEADIFCLPTLGDCLPMVLSEAGAAGLPLVSTRVAGIPELVKDGETGRLIPPGDVQALSQALRDLVGQPTLRLALGARAAETVARDFDAERNTRRLLNVVKSVVDTPKNMGQ